MVFAKTGGRCLYCWDELDYIYDFVCDHYIPLAKGGADDHSNLVPACYFCDNRKRSFRPTPILCETLKKWKHGELVPKAYIDLPAAITKEKLTRGQQRQIKRYKESRAAQIAREERIRFYGKRSTDSGTQEGTPGHAAGEPGSQPSGGFYEGRSDDRRLSTY